MELLERIDPNKFQCTDHYKYQSHNVPRVTEILSAMLHEEYLMGWANAMGLYKRKKHTEITQVSADIGTFVHHFIEIFLKNNESPDYNSIPLSLRSRVMNAFNSFLEWWEIIKKTEYKILMQETTLVCKYFGGTLDMLIEINDKIYIVDFKTSNHPSYKYFLQLSAYRYMLATEHDIEIDGVIILMLNKTTCKFTEMVLDFSIAEHLQYINQCEECFLSLVYAYYNRCLIENGYKAIFGGN